MGLISTARARMERWFYAHGLFCASHPIPVILSVMGIVLFCSAPLVNLVLFEARDSLPLQWRGSLKAQGPEMHEAFHSQYGPKPMVSFQQVVVAPTGPGNSSALTALTLRKELLLTTSEICDTIMSFNPVIRGHPVQFSDFCFRTSIEKECLMLSPTSLWGRNTTRILMSEQERLLIDIGLSPPSMERDLTFVNLRKSESGIAKSASSLLLLFGFRAPDNISHEALGNEYLTLLYRNLSDAYNLSGLEVSAPLSEDAQNTTHLYHVAHAKGGMFGDVMFLVLIYVIVFLYISFSVGKFHMVKSKYGLGFTAVFTVFCSMVSSVGICIYFGATPTLMAIEIIPFMVIAIGVENIFVITNGVVATSIELPVKERVAQGLSQVGVRITLSLFAQLAVFVLGSVTSIAGLKEFCLFATIGALADFFLQCSFFATVLSIDIRRMELSDLHVRKTLIGERKKSQTDLAGMLNQYSDEPVSPVFVKLAEEDSEENPDVSIIRSLCLDPLIVKTVLVLFVMAFALSLHYHSNSREEHTVLPRLDATYVYSRFLRNHLNVDLKYQYVDVLPVMSVSVSVQFTPDFSEPKFFEPFPTPLFSPALPSEVSAGGLLHGAHHGGEVDADLDDVILVTNVVHGLRKTAWNVLWAWRSLHSFAIQFPVITAIVVAFMLFVCAVSTGHYLLSRSPSVHLSTEPASLVRDSSQPLRPSAVISTSGTLWSSADTFAEVTHLKSAHRLDIECIAVDDSIAVTASLDRSIVVWDLLMGKSLRTIAQHPDAIWSLGLCSGTLVVTGCSNGHIGLLDLTTDPTAAQVDFLLMSAHNGGVTCINTNISLLSLLPGQRKRVFISGSVDGSVVLWIEYERVTPVSSASSPPRVRVGLDSSPSMSTSSPLAAVNEDVSLEQTLCRPFEPVQLLHHKRAVTCMQVDAQTLFVGFQDGVVKVFDLAQRLCTMSIYGQTASITTLCIDEGLVVSGAANGIVRVSCRRTGSLIHTLSGHQADILDIKINGGVIVSSSLDDTLMIWDRLTGLLLHSLPQFTPSLQFLDDQGQWLLCGTRGTLVVYNTHTGKVVYKQKLGKSLGPNRIVKLANSSSSSNLTSIVCDLGSDLATVAWHLTQYVHGKIE